MLTLLMSMLLHIPTQDLSSDWRFACLGSEFNKSIDPDFYDIGVIYYDYNKDPAFDPGMVPVLLDVKYYPDRKAASYRFYFQGRSDQQMYYIIRDKGVIVDKFLNTPSTACGLR